VEDLILADLLAFLHEAVTPYHAVAAAKARLDARGYAVLDEADSWAELRPGKYYFTTTGTNLFAFVLPAQVRRFHLVGAHSDSPNLRLKPRAEYTKEGYLQLGVEVYGGALVNSWLDRDLALAGRVLVQERDGSVGKRLLRLDKLILRIPQLAIHLDRDVNDKGLVLNRQEHLPPVLGLAGTGLTAKDSVASLTALLCRELGVVATEILSADLMLYDTCKPAVAGLGNEFLLSGRLDNLAMCHAALHALFDAESRVDDTVPIVAMFDHEEVGSESAAGAHSAVLPRLLERLGGGGREAYFQRLAASACISADMAHAVHPNYPSRHEERHRPQINGGPVIKVNAQQRYATSAETSARFAALCKRFEVPVQYYSHRTDLPCGSTIGPIASTLLGIPTVDIGNPMLSMHSAREMAGTRDPAWMTRALGAFLA
jgi:aspartyl aminopeptidase